MLFLCVSFLGACSDDDAKSNANQLTFNGESYPVQSIRLDPFGASSVNFKMIVEPNGLHELSVVFGDIDEIPDGTYSYKLFGAPDFDSDENFAGGQFYQPDSDSQPITGGTLRFSKVGQEYKVVADVEIPGGRVKANYQGALVR